MRYLGHIIGKNRVRLNPKKIVTLKEFPVPRPQKNVKKILGSAGYYRKFIEIFQKIANPLNPLTYNYGHSP